MVGAAKLTLVRNEVTKETDTPYDDIGVMEAIVTPELPLVDSTPARMRLYDHYQVNLLAVSRAGKRIAHQLRSVRLKAGDVIVLQGNLNAMPETLGELRVLPLAERGLALGRGRRGFVPVIVLGDRDAAGRTARRAGGDRLLRRGGADRPAQGAVAARGL